MSRFDSVGLFWAPEVYVKRGEKVKQDKQPKQLPPIPDTGWKPRAIFPDLSAAKVIGLDTETYDPDLLEKGPGCRRDGYIVGVSVAADDFCAYYPIAHSLGENLDRVPVFAWLKEQLSRKGQAKVGAHILYDLDFLDAAGVEVAGPFYDVQYADPLINEYEMRYSLAAVAERRLGEKKETSLLYQWCYDAYGGDINEQRMNIWRAPSELAGPYAEQDARLPLRILRAQWPILQARGMIPILEMECRLIPLLLHMRKQGVRIDMAKRQEVDDILSGKIKELQEELGINVYAAAELQVLCDNQGIEYPLTATGKASFTKPWLKDNPHPILRKVSELRGFYKLRDTFIRGSMLNSQVNGRVHCEFHPLRSDTYGTVSGRFSSSHPNLQQIPSRDPYWGPLLRSCFVPDEDHLWMKNDLSQIEFRLGVHYGIGEGIEQIRETYRNDEDTNFYNIAAEYTGLPYLESKSVSLGSLYGMGPDKFSRTTGKPIDEAKEIYYRYHNRLPFLKKTYNAVSDEARENGFVVTIGGRVCGLPEGFEHKALNRKLQGSCADWIKRSMLDAYDSGLFDILRIYLTVHDELDSGMPRTAAGIEAAQELHRIMTTAYPLNIPVKAGIDIGPSWGVGEKFKAHNLTSLRNP